MKALNKPILKMESPDKPLVNRVAQSGLVTIDLEDFAPRVTYYHFDLAEHLFQGLVLREKEFRQIVADQDWSACSDNVVLIYCSTDAIVPKWAYMLVASRALPFAASVYFGTEKDHRAEAIMQAIEQFDTNDYTDARVVVKGCAKDEVPTKAYVALINKLQPHVRSLMYGEPCSTVPVYKRR